jgi:uncharacterized sulfatase
LLDFLERENLRTNTLIFYTADNGWVQDPDKPNRPAPRSKLTPYEGGVRTPLMISWLGQLKPRRDRDHLASNVDIWPTLAALLQIEAPDGLPGINLTDVRAVRRRQHIFGEHYPHNVLDVEAPTRGLEHRFVLSGRWKCFTATPPPGRPRRNCSISRKTLGNFATSLPGSPNAFRNSSGSWTIGGRALDSLNSIRPLYHG